MTKTLETFDTAEELPGSSTVVIIGGGIVGVTAALTLAERNIPVVLIEKGHIACEQSSRNLGWIRKTSRHAIDVPLAQAADRLWAEMPTRVGQSVGYKSPGIMFLAKNETQMAVHESWYQSVQSLDLGSQLLGTKDIDRLAPNGQGKWVGGIYTPSDGYAEPTVAATAIAKAAIKQGAVIIQNCAVRSLSTSGGKVSGVITEKGEVRCDQVLLAGGAWSRRFLGNLGISLPTLPVIASVLRTKAIEGPTDIAVGGPDFSYRKHQDGGFIIMQRGKADAPITLDHLKIGMKFRDQLKHGRHALNIALNGTFFRDLATARSWRKGDITPFEKVRVNTPKINRGLLNDALNNTINAWPMFRDAKIDESWAGLIDVTPDSIPVIDRIKSLPGLTVATGFSGHGFGTGPAAGQLAADLVSNTSPIVDPSPYQFDRF